jgi:ferredoxin
MTGSTETRPRLNSEKARRAAQRPDRRGEKCGAEAGAYRPVVDRNACEGKRDCVEVCPYDVFEVRQIDEEDFSSLSFVGKLEPGSRETHRLHAARGSVSGLWTLCSGLSGKGNQAGFEQRIVRKGHCIDREPMSQWLRPKVKLQIPPLRYATVGMTK